MQTMPRTISRKVKRAVLFKIKLLQSQDQIYGSEQDQIYGSEHSNISRKTLCHSHEFDRDSQNVFKKI